MSQNGQSKSVQRKYVFEKDDVRGIPAVEGEDVDAVVNGWSLQPYVAVKGTEAHIYCVFWDDSKGLVSEHAVMKYDSNTAMQCRIIEDKIIYHSDRHNAQLTIFDKRHHFVLRNS